MSLNGWKFSVRVMYLLLFALCFAIALRAYPYPLSPVFIWSLAALIFLFIFSFPKPCSILAVRGRKLKPASPEFSQWISKRLIETNVVKKVPERILVINTPQINACGIGAIFGDALIFTKGLLTKLKKGELLAISLHEVYHCKNLHVAFLIEVFAISFIGLINLFIGSPFWIIVLPLWALPFLESYLYWQYSADELAVKGGYEKQIISAIEKSQRLKKREKRNKLYWLGRITHPSVEKRIKRIRKLSEELSEQHVRNVLEKEFGQKFTKKKIKIGYYTHQFDLLSEDRSIVGVVKSGRYIDSTGKIKPYRFAECCLDCLYLMSANIENKIFVLTDKQMYEAFKKMIAGLPIKNVEIRLVEV